jgi:hypothetical protein
MNAKAMESECGIVATARRIQQPPNNMAPAA